MDIIFWCLYVLIAGFILYGVVRLCYVKIHNALIIRKANKFGTPDLCCCGAMLEDHGWGDNHCFVSEMEYFIECNTKKF